MAVRVDGRSPRPCVFHAGMNVHRSLSSVSRHGWPNCPESEVAWPGFVEEISVRKCCDQPIEAVAWPDSIRQFSFGEDLTQSIEGVVWPTALRVLSFGAIWEPPLSSMFCMFLPVDKARWPTSFPKLSIGSRFVWSLDGQGNGCLIWKSCRLYRTNDRPTGYFGIWRCRDGGDGGSSHCRDRTPKPLHGRDMVRIVYLMHELWRHVAQLGAMCTVKRLADKCWKVGRVSVAMFAIRADVWGYCFLGCEDRAKGRPKQAGSSLNPTSEHGP